MMEVINHPCDGPPCINFFYWKLISLTHTYMFMMKVINHPCDGPPCNNFFYWKLISPTHTYMFVYKCFGNVQVG